MKILLYVSTLLVISGFWLRVPGQSVQFASENLTVSVLYSCCTLDGVYSFVNQGPVAARWSISYPLLNTKELPFPDSISISDNSTHEQLRFEKTDDGVLFSLEVQPKKTKRIRIRYWQQTPAHAFEYILTTTRAWGKPLELAEFHIVIPDSLRLISCSPPFDATGRKDQQTVYHIKKKRFMPASNLVITWKRRIQ